MVLILLAFRSSVQKSRAAKLLHTLHYLCKVCLMSGGRRKTPMALSFNSKEWPGQPGWNLSSNWSIKDTSLHSRNNNCSLVLTRSVAWVLMDKKYWTHSRLSKEDRNRKIKKLSSSVPCLAGFVRLVRFAEMLASLLNETKVNFAITRNCFCEVSEEDVAKLN